MNQMLKQDSSTMYIMQTTCTFMYFRTRYQMLTSSIHIRCSVNHHLQQNAIKELQIIGPLTVDLN